VLDALLNRRSTVAPSQPKTLAPLYWGAIVTTIIAAGITLAIFWLGGRTQNEDEWIRHTLAVRAELHDIHALMLRAESSQRGYLLTGRPDYLSNYTPALSALQDAVNRVDALVRDNARQVEAVGVLRQRISDKREEMQTTIDERNAGRADAALALVNTDRGKLATAAIKDQIDAMVETENAALAQREAAVTSFVFFLQVGSAVAFLLIGGVGLLVAYFARRSLTAIQSANLQLSAANQNLLDEINQREQAESQLRQSQKMDAIGQLTGGIAHDFNNMLGVVIGSLDMMRRRMKTDEFGVGRFIDAATKATERSAALTQRLLAFARQQPLSPEPVDANRMIAEMSELLRSTLGEHIQIETVTAAGLWKTSVDVHQLENAIVNVALNARDAMPDGGKLTIETANVYLDEDYCRDNGEVSPGQFVMVAVTDEGVGMDPQVAERVFDPFFTTKPSGKGTGLGLSQVYGFIKQSHGHVKIYSELGTGTTVKIYLPRLRGRGDEIKRPMPQEVKGDASETILVVEDDPLMRRLSTDLLRELGYTVIESESGAEALALLDATPGVTLLFTDVVMPEMNGKKLAEAALERRPDLKILFTTGYTRNAVVHGGVLDPDINFISKPFAIRQLASKVRAVLDR
jgi:signal transduction histidine kinase